MLNSFGIKQKKEIQLDLLFLCKSSLNYIMPPIPPPPIGGMAGPSSFTSATTHSVVKSKAAIEAAFSKAKRVTLVGLIIPA
jgi:hypothetical protein